MSAPAFQSAAAAHEARQLYFAHVMRPTCACARRELRQEHGALVCAHCASPFVIRTREAA